MLNDKIKKKINKQKIKNNCNYKPKKDLSLLGSTYRTYWSNYKIGITWHKKIEKITKSIFKKKKNQCRIMRWGKNKSKNIWYQPLLAYKTHALGYLIRNIKYEKNHESQFLTNKILND
jgi:hypothetical protein